MAGGHGGRIVKLVKRTANVFKQERKQKLKEKR